MQLVFHCIQNEQSDVAQYPCGIDHTQADLSTERSTEFVDCRYGPTSVFHERLPYLTAIERSGCYSWEVVSGSLPICESPFNALAKTEVARAECSPDRADGPANVPHLHVRRHDCGHVYRQVVGAQGRCRY